ncbi:GTPase required for pre-60S ribosomal subunit nuclear export and maturation, partial [Coemansia spiralis]
TSEQAATDAMDEAGDDDDEDEDEDHIARASLNISQKFSKIPVVADFLPIDLEGDKELKALEDAASESESDSPAPAAAKRKRASASAGSDDGGDAVTDGDDADADWDEVFRSAGGAEAAKVDSELESDASSAEDDASEAGAESESEPDEPPKRQKAPRMSTNKMKVGAHYYETANVKNRSRNKTRPVAPSAQVKRMRKPGLWSVSKKR